MINGALNRVHDALTGVELTDQQAEILIRYVRSRTRQKGKHMDKPEVVATQPIQGPIEPPKGLTVGRNCHYVTLGGRHLAAIVTDVTDRQAGIVSLIAFDPELGYSPHKYEVRYDPLNPTYDTWHYIEPVID